MMKLLLLVGIGSLIGGVSRYLINLIFTSNNKLAFPFTTFAINITGSLLIGLILGLAVRNELSEQHKLFWTTGVLGGFTTFSAFSAETFHLIKHHMFATAFVYMFASVICAVAGTFVGFTISKFF